MNTWMSERVNESINQPTIRSIHPSTCPSVSLCTLPPLLSIHTSIHPSNNQPINQCDSLTLGVTSSLFQQNARHETMHSQVLPLSNTHTNVPTTSFPRLTALEAIFA